MSTYDYMSDADHQACADAGRGEPPDPYELADMERDERRDRGDLCPECGEPVEHVSRGIGVVYIDLWCPYCEWRDPDTEGGV